MRRGALAFVVVLAGVARPHAAAADTKPSSWDFARDPLERGRWELHVAAERHMHPRTPDTEAGDEPPSPFDAEKFQELNLEQARLALEEADAAHSPDPRLAFDLGAVYERLASIRADRALDEKVVDVLEPALAAHPDHPGATVALYSLAVALAKLDRPREELAAWRRYIPRLVDDTSRLTPMMNMGEAEMRVGQLDGAWETLHAALDICKSLPNSASLSMAYALTLWDLAIVLDRQGDSSAALREAAAARAFSWTVSAPLGVLQGRLVQTGWDAIRDEVEVFFAPDWEREWYLALGEAAAASGARSPRDAARLWTEAERHWDVYCSRAEAAAPHAAEARRRGAVAEKWLAIAKVRRDRAHRARIAAEKAAAASGPSREAP